MIGDGGQEEGWVVCRIFKKKNHLKTLDSPLASSSISGESRRSSHMFDSCEEGVLEQILQQMGRTCKEENDVNNFNNNTNNIRFARPFDAPMMHNNNGGYHERFMKLPSLESPKSTHHSGYQPMIPDMVTDNEGSFTTDPVCGSDPNPTHLVHQMEPPSLAGGSAGGGGLITNWAALDRLVASQLNGQTETSRQFSCFSTDPTSMGYCTSDHDLQIPTVRSSSSSTIISSTTSSHSNRAAYNMISPTQDFSNEIDLWNIARSTSSLLSSSEPLCHVSNTSV